MNLKAFIFLFLTFGKYSYSQISEQCIKSNTFWNTIKYSYENVLKINSTQSAVLNCLSVPSMDCCKSEMKKDMTSLSEIKLKKYTETTIDGVLKMFSNDSYDLFEIFSNDLKKTKNDLHQLFSVTYAHNYKMNKNFFFTWFDNLKLYMEGRLHNIGTLMDTFFRDMAMKIVTILIAPGTKQSTIKCHTDRLMESNPYQNTDVLLKKKIIRSYPPARMLANGITVGRDVFNRLLTNSSPTQNCMEQFNSIFHCMICDGLVLKPCASQCREIIGDCFGSFRSSDVKRFDRTFTKYIKILVQLAGKLDNPFNFLEVNSKLTIQISTGIMNIQTLYPNIKEQIEMKCQTDQKSRGSDQNIVRRRRQESEESYQWQSVNDDNQNPILGKSATKSTSRNPNYEVNNLNNYQQQFDNALSIIVRKIKKRYKLFENYFRNKKSEFCTPISITDLSASCWNGTAVTKNTVSQSRQEATKRQGDNIVDSTMKSAISQLEDVTERISSYLTDRDVDPRTAVILDHKSTPARNEDKPTINMQENLFTKKIEGSGESESNKQSLLNMNSEKQKSQFPQQPDKTSWEFPSLPDGSGDTSRDSEDIKVRMSPQKKTKTAPSLVSLTRSSTVSSNQISDDEDLNPVRRESKPNNKPLELVSSTTIAILQPEGSGNEPPSPDSIPINQVTIGYISTTESFPIIPEGSGQDSKPKKERNKPDQVFPILPDSTSPTRNKEIPAFIPDNEVVLPEGSGKSQEQPTVTSRKRRPVVESTSEPSVPVSRDNYPGKVPSEVWLPGLDGARNRGQHNRKTTPSGAASKIYIRALRQLFLPILLILLSVM